MERIEWDCFADETKEYVSEICKKLRANKENAIHTIIVWFHAEWCKPCKRIEPDVLALVEKMGVERDDCVWYDILVPSDDIEKNELKDIWGFQTIPTFFLIDVNEQTITEKKWDECKDFALSSN